MTTLITSNEKMNKINKIVKSLEDAGLLIVLVKQSKIMQKNKSLFLSMLLGTLGASLLGNLLTGKGVMTAGERKIRACQDF